VSCIKAKSATAEDQSSPDLGSMFIAIVVVTVNFIVDMLYAALDPRIKYGD